MLVAWPRIEAHPRDCAINTVSAAKKLHECFRIVLILNCVCLVRCYILLSACNGENCRSILLYLQVGQGPHSDAERHGKRNNDGKQTAWNFYNYQMLLLACRLWHSWRLIVVVNHWRCIVLHVCMYVCMCMSACLPVCQFCLR